MINQLLFKRQFILSSSPEFGFSEWNNIKLNNSAYLSVHPELEVNQSYCNDIQLTLLGFIVDPFAPNKSNKEILDQIIRGAKGFDDVVANTNALAGRWIIIYQDANTFKLFNDLCGQRRVYYFRKLSDFLIGSDPSIIGHFVKLEENSSKDLQEFITSAKFHQQELAWIGSDTIYNGVKHLMPNHYLDIRSLKATRYWPNKHLRKIDLMEAVEIASAILKGTLLAASKRQPLAMAVTAGWDSRVLLAASREISNEVTYFVSVPEEEKRDIADVVIPSKLFSKLGLPFEVQKCSNIDDQEFLYYFNKNVALSRINIPKSKFIYRYYLDFKGKLNINGNVNEIARTDIRPILPVKICGDELAKLSRISYPNIPYVANQLDIWIEGVYKLCTDYGLSIFDMLYWEQRMGNWGTLYPAEQDIAVEQFSPFNNRFLISMMLSVDEKYRMYPSYTFYNKIIKKLWPELLDVPISPQKFKDKTKNTIKYSLMRLTGVF